MITLDSKLGKGVRLVLGDKSSVEDWCLRMNSQYCIVYCKGNCLFSKLRGLIVMRGSRFTSKAMLAIGRPNALSWELGNS